MVAKELIKEIEADIKGKFQLQLEAKTIASITKLEQEGKMSKAEVSNLYRTDFKKLFSGNIDTTNTLFSKMQQLNTLTDKLITDKLKTNPEAIIDSLKSVIYGALSIDINVNKNNLAKNMAKGVIDELLSLPEMLVELFKHPIDFAKGLKTALVDNFSATLKSMGAQYTNMLQGMETPYKVYETGRSLTLVIMTLIPGATGKALSNIAKNVGKGTTTVGKGAINVSKGATKLGESVVKKELKTLAKEVGKNGTESFVDASSS